MEPVDIATLLDTAAAAARCNYSYCRFIRLRTSGRTPPPDAWRGKRPLYSAATLDAWLVTRGVKATWRLVPDASAQIGDKAA